MERRSPIRPKLSAFHQQQNPDRNIQSTGKLHFVPDSLSVHGQTTYVLLILFPLNPIISVNWHKCTDGHVQQKVQLMTALFLKHLSTTWASASCDSLTEWWNRDWEIWNFTSWEWCVITTVHKISQVHDSCGSRSPAVSLGHQAVERVANRRLHYPTRLIFIS